METRIRLRRSAATAEQAGDACRPLWLYGISLITFLASLAAPTSASSTGNPCPSGYQGFILTGLCSRVAWCNYGTLEFETTCGEGRILDAETLACLSENEYDCQTQAPMPVTDNPDAHTISPSDIHSTVQTKQPTVHPAASASLSASPMRNATDVASSSPTVMRLSSLPVSASSSAEPTDASSEVPSALPSNSPSSKAPVTPKQTASPSKAPSSEPSRSPTSIPSSMPSLAPSAGPSESPSTVSSSLPSRAASSVPSTMLSSGPSSEPSSRPSSLPSGGATTATPTVAPVKTRASPSTTPEFIISNNKITAPEYAPVTISVASAKYEIAMAGLSTFLFNTAFAELNNILDGMVVSNLQLSTVIQDVKFSTSLLSQGIYRRFNSDATLAASPLTNMRFQPISSTIVTRPQSNRDYKVNLSDDFLVLRRRLQSSVAAEAVPEDDEAEGRESQQPPPPTLFAIMQKQMYITVPGTGPNGEYDTELIPSINELNGSISTVFSDQTQKALFVSWLRAGDVDDFNDVLHADFVGFVNDYWTMPMKSQANVVMSSTRLRTTTDFPGGSLPLL